MSEREIGKIWFLKLAENEIKAEISLLKEFLNESSISLTKKRSEILENINHAKTSNENFEYAKNLENEVWKFDEPFKKFSYNSQLLSHYAFFESWLKKLCDYHHRLGFNQITVVDLNGQNYIEKSKLYFQKVAGIHLGELQEEWKRIQTIQQIRNLIAHNDSNIVKISNKPISDQPQFQILINENFINLDRLSGSFYIEDQQFLIDLLELFESYLTKIIDKLDKPKVIIKSSELPYDMGNWGLEKIEDLIQSTIHGIQLLENCEQRYDEFRYTDTIANSISNYKGMNWNLTKLLSMFSGGSWDIKDSETINKKGRLGLEEIKKKYNIIDLKDIDFDHLSFEKINPKEIPF